MPSSPTVRQQIEQTIARTVRDAPSARNGALAERLPFGIAEVDALTGGGLAAGAISELIGAPCSGRTTLALSFASGVTRSKRSIAWIDVSDALDPESAAAASVDLSRMLWVRCGASYKRDEKGPQNEGARRQNARQKIWTAVDQALRSSDLLLQGGGFGALVLDLGSILPEFSSRIPLATWFRFRAAAERSRTAVVVLSQYPSASSSAELVLRLDQGEGISMGRVLRGLRFSVAVERRRSATASQDISDRVRSIRKPPQSERGFPSRSALWSGKAVWAVMSFKQETLQAAEVS